MKKIFILTLATMVSACACFDCSNDEPIHIRTSNDAKLNCDYFDGRTCYRYVYKKPDHPVVKPQPVRYRKCQNTIQTCNSCAPCNSCGDKVSETREPVEVVYKKTTYKTVCDPKTVSQVSYETVPYAETNEK